MLAISELAGLDEHHPDVDVRYAGVLVRLITITAEYYGLSQRDVELAQQIWAAARKLVAADPTAVQAVQVAIDALVIPECCHSGVPCSATASVASQRT